MRKGKLSKREESEQDRYIRAIAGVFDAVRTEQKHTTTSLGAVIGASQAQVSRLLNGKQPMRFQMFFRFCKALKLAPAEVIAQAETRPEFRPAVKKTEAKPEPAPQAESQTA